MASWQRLIRFVGDDDEVHYGEPIISSAAELIHLLDQGKLSAKELRGATPFDCTETGKELKVKSLLGPLLPANVPIIRCVGLNYMKHSKYSSTDSMGVVRRKSHVRLISSGRWPQTPTLSVHFYQTVARHCEVGRRHSGP